MKRASALIAVFCCALGPTTVAEEPPALTKNPFSRPPQLLAAGSPGSRNTAEDHDGQLVLLATLVSGDRGLANVGGRILRPGQSVHGFRLLRVEEDRAVFEAGGEHVTLLVKPERDEDNE